MTYQEFLKALEKTPRDWVALAMITRGKERRIIRRGSEIRDNQQCPISSLLDETSHWYESVGYRIGLSQTDINIISMAADSAVPHDQKVRADLLRACGLSDSV